MNYACKNKNNPINYLPKNCISRCTNRPSRRCKPVASGWLVYREGNIRFDFICETWINWSYILNWFHSGMSEIVLSHNISTGIEIQKRGYNRKYPRNQCNSAFKIIKFPQKIENSENRVCCEFPGIVRSEHHH